MRFFGDFFGEIFLCCGFLGEIFLVVIFLVAIFSVVICSCFA